MEKHYLTLTDGRKVRIIVTEEVILEFERVTNKSRSVFFGNPPAATIKDLTCFILLSAKAGEHADGKELMPEKLFRYMRTSQLYEIADIMTKIAVCKN